MPSRLVCSDCEEGKKGFLYAQKVINNSFTKIHLKQNHLMPDLVTENHVCPFCKSLNISEAPPQEPKKNENQALEDMTFVPFESIKEFLNNGYVQLDEKDHIYAKGLVMLKRKTATDVRTQ